MLRRFFVTCFIYALIVGGVALLFFHGHSSRQPPAAPAQAPETRIRLIEGWTNQQMANYLQNRQIVSADDFLKAQAQFTASEYPILQSKPAAADLEGFIFPDTYFIPQSVPSSTNISSIIIQKTLDNFSQKFTPQMQAQAAAHNLTVYQAVILASIIEKETGRDATTTDAKAQLQTDRGMISGIFYNRLNSGMPLQSDATINFITGKNEPSVSTEETQIDSPYNTYKYAGLPPGPICNPSLSSLEAAVNPTPSDYYYFLSAPDGTIIYSKTYSEHLANKQKYLQ